MRGLAIAGALAVTAVGTAAQYRSSTVQYLTEYDEDKTITVPAGAELRVRLRQQGGEGYRWDLRQNDRVQLLRPPGVVSGGIIGGGKQSEFRLRVIAPGRFPLVFGLRAQGQQPVREMAFTINAVTRQPAYPDRDRNDGPDTVEPLTRGDAGRSIDIPVGQEQTIALDANPSTGYSWRVVRADNVSLIGSIRYEAADAPRGMVGRGGTALVPFRVVSRGLARLTLEYSGGPGRPGQQLTYFFEGI